MDLVHLDEKNEIARFLEQDPYLHIYGLGDLDEFFWPYTAWYGMRSEGDLKAIALVYSGPELPTLLALCSDHDSMASLLTSVGHLIPDRFYAHLSPGLEAVFRDDFEPEFGADHHKMALLDCRMVRTVDTSGVVGLGTDDLPELAALYTESYPGNWFDPRMLETGQYFGIRDGARIVSAAGVHVYSRPYRVAALGNITTRPDRRNEGYGTRVTAGLCQSLLRAGVRIGLNVQADNSAAISCYTRLGFQVCADYGEFVMERRVPD